MIILGIDPGTAIMGYGVIEKVSHVESRCIAYGVVTTSPKSNMGNRLVELAKDLNDIIEKYKPDVVGIEELYFFKNEKTVITVAQARGVILQEVAKRNIPYHEFTPLQIKQAVTGYGLSKKANIQEAVKLWLKLETIPKPDDAADGLAVALTVSHVIRGLL